MAQWCFVFNGSVKAQCGIVKQWKSRAEFSKGVVKQSDSARSEVKELHSMETHSGGKA